MAPALSAEEGQTPIPQASCGNEGEPACSFNFTSLLNARCDTGLVLTFPKCGCAIPGPFGSCLLAKRCATCVNYTRRNPEIDLFFVGAWADWALRNQRDLAEDEPLNWVMQLGTHNSFNTIADGHAIADVPNQVYSMTDQLRSGARLITLDLYYLAGAARLCHSPNAATASLVCPLPGDPLYTGTYPPGLRYYANGIKEIRNWLQKNPGEVLILDLEDYIHTMNGPNGDVLGPLTFYLGSRLLPPPLQAPPGFDQPRWPTRREMLEEGHQVIVVDNDPISFVADDVRFSEPKMIAGTYGDGTWLARNQRRYPDCFTPEIAENLFTKASIVVEERELFFVHFGTLGPSDVASAAECNYSLIVMDRFSQLVNPLDPVAYTFLPDPTRQAAAVWSWKPLDRGQNGDCALLEASSRRWVSADCGTHAAFACARPRSESGLDPLQWEDPLGQDWKITEASGEWADGVAACEAEFPGYEFGVPVNGYQNRKLSDANTAGSDLWLNYSQREARGKWGITRLPNVNSPPVAHAGADQFVECGTAVTLDGSASRDRDGDPLVYTWEGPFGTLTGEVVHTTIPLGTYGIALTVTDDKGASSKDSITIKTVDKTPPSMTFALSRDVLSPRSRGLKKIVARIEVSDRCDSEPPSVELVSIADDLESGGARGARKRSVVGAKIGTDDRQFRLRADAPKLAKRVYTVTYRATDLSGNATESSAQVEVLGRALHR